MNRSTLSMTKMILASLDIFCLMTCLLKVNISFRTHLLDEIKLLDLSGADAKPIAEVFPQFVLQQLDLLLDVELLPQLDQNAVDRVEVVRVLFTNC